MLLIYYSAKILQLFIWIVLGPYCCAGFPLLQRAGIPSACRAGPRARGSVFGARAPALRRPEAVVHGLLLQGVWDLPGTRDRTRVSRTGRRILTTEMSGKPPERNFKLKRIVFTL